MADTRIRILTPEQAQAKLDLKASLASPAFTGTPTISGTPITRFFTSREALVSTLASNAGLSATLISEGRDIYLGSYWSNGPAVQMRYRVVTTNPTGDVTKITLDGSHWLTQVFDGDKASVHAFGSYCDGGAHDDLPATQAAVNWALASNMSSTNTRTVTFPAGTYYHSAPIVVGNDVNGAYTRTSFIGEGGLGSVLFISTTSNGAHWSILASLMWGMTWQNISYSWSTDTTATNTGRNVFNLGSGGGSFFNNTISDSTMERGHYYAKSAGMLWWGVRVARMTLQGNVTGGLYSLTGAAGQPNNSFEDVYISAQSMIGPIYQGNAMDVAYRNVEINAANQNPILLEDQGGGGHDFDVFRCEVFNFTGNAKPIQVANTKLTVGRMYFAGGTIANNAFVTLISSSNNVGAFIDIGDLEVSPDNMGTGATIVVFGGSGGASVSSKANRVRFGDIRTSTLTWNTNLWLADPYSSLSPDGLYVEGWDVPARTEFWGDSDGTVINYTPRVNVFNVPLTANRTITLPEGNTDPVMWSGRRFEFYKPVVGTGDLIIRSGISEVARIPAAKTGHVTVVWNRGLPNGNSARTWTVVDKTPVPTSLNVKDFGARGDGVTADDAAFLAVLTIAKNATRAVPGQPDPAGSVVIEVPAGDYRLTNANALLGVEAPTAKGTGLRYKGAGKSITQILFDPATGTNLATNDFWIDLGFEDIGFIAMKPDCTFLNASTTHSGQNFNFKQCRWTAFKYVAHLTGDNNNSEWHFTGCGSNRIQADGAFLHIPDSGGSDQFLNFWFYGCTHWSTDAPFIDAARGGSFHIFGLDASDWGAGITTPVTSSASPGKLFYLRGTSHSDGVQNFEASGVRMEIKNPIGGLLYSEWAGGAVAFRNCDLSSQAFINTYTETVSIKYVNVNGPNYLIDNCVMVGAIRVAWSAADWAHQHRITVRNSEFVGLSRPDQAVVYDGTEAPYTQNKPIVEFVQCRGTGANDPTNATTGAATWDASIGYTGEMLYSLKKRELSIRGIYGLPYADSGNHYPVLPVGALVTDLEVMSPAGAVSDGNGGTYTFTDGSGRALGTLTIPAPLSAGFRVSLTLPVPLLISTATQAKITVTAAGATQPNANAVLLLKGYW